MSDFVYQQDRPRCEACGAHVWHWWDCDRPDKPEHAKRNTELFKPEQVSNDGTPFPDEEADELIEELETAIKDHQSYWRGDQGQEEYDRVYGLWSFLPASDEADK